MPSLLDLHLLPSPLVDPMSYPGAALRHSFLWLDSWVYRVEPERWRRAVGVGRRRSTAGRWRVAAPPFGSMMRCWSAGAHADGRPVPGAGLRVQRLPGATADQVRGAEPGAPGHPGAARIGGRAGVGPFAARQHPRLPAVRHRRRRARCGPRRVRAVARPGATRRARPDRAELPAGADARPAVSAARGRLDTIGEYSAYQGRWGALRWPGETLRRRRPGRSRRCSAGSGGSRGSPAGSGPATRGRGWLGWRPTRRCATCG